jgi:predicted ferric reductase
LWNGPYAVREHPFSFSSSAEHNGRLAFTIKELGDFTFTIKDATPGKIAYLEVHTAHSVWTGTGRTGMCSSLVAWGSRRS